MYDYGVSSTPDTFHIDDLLDFSNEDIFSSSTTADFHLPPPQTTTSNSFSSTTDIFPNFPHDICLPNDDVAELEWLSNFVADDSSSYVSNLIGSGRAMNITNTTSIPAKARSKRPKASITHHSWTSSSSTDSDSKYQPFITPRSYKAREKDMYSPSSRGRKCTHCASEKTPQWRTGPMGPKTLCNACGVRYKSGRLVPEYRPAASPTFTLTQHSNSHRKVLELRRQKEAMMEDEDNNNNGHEFFHHHDFKVC